MSEHWKPVPFGAKEKPVLRVTMHFKMPSGKIACGRGDGYYASTDPLIVRCKACLKRIKP